MLNIQINPQILDSGPMYHEFHMDAFVKEPWNAVSSLFFLVPVIFWLWKLRGQYKDHLIITLLLPLLLLNGIGSALYHAFRNSELFLLMDWMPAFIMNLILAGYFWYKIVGKVWKSVVIVFLFYALTIFLMMSIGSYANIETVNIGYLLIGISIFLPIILFLIRTNFSKWHLIVITILLLSLSLLFRTLDYPTPNPFPEILPQGTHFLWHIFSAGAVFSLGYYLYFVKEKVQSTKTKEQRFKNKD